ncbi:MAG: hypothetical protein HRF50_16905 [Phycisphaerae bacterium]|jgi:hypothetical protein
MPTRRVVGPVTACAGLLLVMGAIGGCVSVKAPERIEIGGRARPEPVDSSRVPDTATHDEARRELAKAYQNIQYLERENARLARQAADYKRERDECREGRD